MMDWDIYSSSSRNLHLRNALKLVNRSTTGLEKDAVDESNDSQVAKKIKHCASTNIVNGEGSVYSNETNVLPNSNLNITQNRHVLAASTRRLSTSKEAINELVKSGCPQVAKASNLDTCTSHFDDSEASPKHSETKHVTSHFSPVPSTSHTLENGFEKSKYCFNLQTKGFFSDLPYSKVSENVKTHYRQRNTLPPSNKAIHTDKTCKKPRGRPKIIRKPNIHTVNVECSNEAVNSNVETTHNSFNEQNDLYDNSIEELSRKRKRSSFGDEAFCLFYDPPSDIDIDESIYTTSYKVENSGYLRTRKNLKSQRNEQCSPPKVRLSDHDANDSDAANFKKITNGYSRRKTQGHIVKQKLQNKLQGSKVQEPNISKTKKQTLKHSKYSAELQLSKLDSDDTAETFSKDVVKDHSKKNAKSQVMKSKKLQSNSQPNNSSTIPNSTETIDTEQYVGPTRLDSSVIDNSGYMCTRKSLKRQKNEEYCQPKLNFSEHDTNNSAAANFKEVTNGYSIRKTQLKQRLHNKLQGYQLEDQNFSKRKTKTFKQGNYAAGLQSSDLYSDGSVETISKDGVKEQSNKKAKNHMMKPNKLLSNSHPNKSNTIPNSHLDSDEPTVAISKNVFKEHSNKNAKSCIMKPKNLQSNSQPKDSSTIPNSTVTIDTEQYVAPAGLDSSVLEKDDSPATVANNELNDYKRNSDEVENNNELNDYKTKSDDVEHNKHCISQNDIPIIRVLHFPKVDSNLPTVCDTKPAAVNGKRKSSKKYSAKQKKSKFSSKRKKHDVDIRNYNIANNKAKNKSQAYPTIGLFTEKALSVLYHIHHPPAQGSKQAKKMDLQVKKTKDQVIKKMLVHDIKDECKSIKSDFEYSKKNGCQKKRKLVDDGNVSDCDTCIIKSDNKKSNNMFSSLATSEITPSEDTCKNILVENEEFDSHLKNNKKNENIPLKVFIVAVSPKKIPLPNGGLTSVSKNLDSSSHLNLLGDETKTTVAQNISMPIESKHCDETCALRPLANLPNDIESSNVCTESLKKHISAEATYNATLNVENEIQYPREETESGTFSDLNVKNTKTYNGTFSSDACKNVLSEQFEMNMCLRQSKLMKVDNKAFNICNPDKKLNESPDSEKEILSVTSCSNEEQLGTNSNHYTSHFELERSNDKNTTASENKLPISTDKKINKVKRSRVSKLKSLKPLSLKSAVSQETSEECSDPVSQASKTDKTNLISCAEKISDSSSQISISTPQSCEPSSMDLVVSQDPAEEYSDCLLQETKTIDDYLISVPIIICDCEDEWSNHNNSFIPMLRAQVSKLTSMVTYFGNEGFKPLTLNHLRTFCNSLQELCLQSDTEINCEIADKYSGETTDSFMDEPLNEFSVKDLKPREFIDNALSFHKKCLYQQFDSFLKDLDVCELLVAVDCFCNNPKISRFMSDFFFLCDKSAPPSFREAKFQFLFPINYENMPLYTIVNSYIKHFVHRIWPVSSKTITGQDVLAFAEDNLSHVEICIVSLFFKSTELLNLQTLVARFTFVGILSIYKFYSETNKC